MSKNFSKVKRQEKIKEKVTENPFLSDEQLSKLFKVSIQTIRLDRLEMGIPEMRKRVIMLAQKASSKVKALNKKDIIGDLIDIELGKSGIATMHTSKDMAFGNSKLVRSHYIFSLADSLAMAIIDADVVLTGIARLRYKNPVYIGQLLVAKAKIATKKSNKYLVSIHIRCDNTEVFTAKLIMVSMDKDLKKPSFNMLNYRNKE
ncbi:MAG: transcription factor FapR [Candidatus Caldatribacteriota bacterium]|jgi:acyl-coenzyme A thioesterase PaaI-like protein|nr:transcription factor FapR [Atribacterota bacterium]MDD3031022.1 transcription factor FapR [Atribacterota bacterium]MDD3640191.1 transcription factor FapR [Atribacterota bacterium]MDD4288535.1 transcription factor FapR [Atribacterota bacterium]MDD4765246.1 transcription factor FapR [Atribacterota bacterium]